jgi:hypothetical protein
LSSAEIRYWLYCMYCAVLPHVLYSSQESSTFQMPVRDGGAPRSLHSPLSTPSWPAISSQPVPSHANDERLAARFLPSACARRQLLGRRSAAAAAASPSSLLFTPSMVGYLAGCLRGRATQLRDLIGRCSSPILLSPTPSRPATSPSWVSREQQLGARVARQGQRGGRVNQSAGRGTVRRTRLGEEGERGEVRREGGERVGWLQCCRHGFWVW